MGCTHYLKLQFQLKDDSLIKTQGFINGKWLDAKDGGTITVQSSLETTIYGDLLIGEQIQLQMRISD